MADYLICFVILLVVLLCENSGARSQAYHEETSTEHRSKRSEDCPKSFNKKDGYSPLKKENVVVDFLRIEEVHTARVKWECPTVVGVPVNEFLIEWEFPPITYCKLVSNETLKYNITLPPEVWRDDNYLFVGIQPMPQKNGNNQYDLLRYTPNYQGPTSSAPIITRQTNATPSYWSSANSTSPVSSTRDELDHEDEYSIKLIIGTVIGIAVTIVLVIVLVHSCYYNRVPPHSKDVVIYISFHADNEKIRKEIKEVAFWLRDNGFLLEMITDENDMLSEKNRKSSRELATFMFRENMIKTADKVLMIISPSYLKLCRMTETGDAKNENISEDEKLVYGEICQIRCELHARLYNTDRFIILLFHVNEADDVPFWMKEIGFFSLPKDKKNNRLLNRLNGLPEYFVEFYEELVSYFYGVMMHEGNGGEHESSRVFYTLLEYSHISRVHYYTIKARDETTFLYFFYNIN